MVMVQWLRQRRRRVFLFFLVLSAQALAASGGDETEISPRDVAVNTEEAQDLVAQGRFDDAIAFLSQVARDYPDQIDWVQKEIKRIIVFRDAFNKIFEDVVDAIEEKDYEKANASITELESIDTDPNRGVKNIIRMAKLVVARAIHNSILDGIIERGNVLLKAGEHLEAVEVYREGFDVYRDIFSDFLDYIEGGSIPDLENDPQRAEIVKAAYTALGEEGTTLVVELETSLDLWANAAAELNTVIGEAESRIAGTDSEVWLSNLAPVFERLNLVDESSVAVQAFNDPLEELIQDFYTRLNGIPEEFWLEAVNTLLEGRREAPSPEGIFDALDRHWGMGHGTILDAALSLTRDLDDEGRRLYDSGAWDDVASGFETAVRASSVALEILALADERLAVEAADGGSWFRDFYAPRREYLAALDPASDTWSSLALLNENFPVLPDFTETVPTVELIGNLDDSIRDGVEEVDALTAAWRTNRLTALARPGGDAPMITELSRKLEADLDAAGVLYRNLRFNLLKSAMETVFANLKQDAENSFTDLDEVRFLVRGTVSEEEEALIERHPSLALEEFLEPSLTALGESEADIENFLSQYGEVVEQVADGAEAERYLSLAEDLLLEITEYTNDGSVLSIEAETYVRNARRAENAGNNALERAGREAESGREALLDGDFDGALTLYNAALESLDEVGDFYLTILENDVDIAAASGLDRDRRALGDQIVETLENTAVTVARDAITEGRRSYETQNFSEGLLALSQAREFWESARGESNPELDLWLTRLRNAVQAVTQTSIETSDPLFTEMYQYLNLAHKYYDEGLRLAETPGGEAEAMRAFSSAGDLVSQILLPFPGNKAALTLEQKIFRQENAEAWTAQSLQTVNAARRALATQDVLAAGRFLPELQALADIDSNLSGLSQTIFDVRVLLGLEFVGPSSADIQRSRSLTVEAESLWANEERRQFVNREALDLLNTALLLNPDNVEASLLKDEVARSVGGQVTVTLSLSDQNLFRQAEEFYAQESYVQAWALVRRLLDGNPSNAYYAPLKNLERRLEARVQ